MDLSKYSMTELFRAEADAQCNALSDGLLSIAQIKDRERLFRNLMRAAHSLKGAARIVQFEPAVRVSHAMEDVFTAVQEGRLHLAPNDVDTLLTGVDLLREVAGVEESDLKSWEKSNQPLLQEFVVACGRLGSTERDAGAAVDVPAVPVSSPPPDESPEPSGSQISPGSLGTSLRVQPQALQRIIGLAGESLVLNGRIAPIDAGLRRVIRDQRDLERRLGELRDQFTPGDPSRDSLEFVRDAASSLRKAVERRVEEIELFERQNRTLSRSLYGAALMCRMRPLSDRVAHLRRMCRDVARDLGKEVRVEITGERTDVDRDLLDVLDAPLTHLLRNAVDHGIETPDERNTAGKKPFATIHIHAQHRAGRLLLSVSDDGRGVDFSKIREQVVVRKFVNAATAAQLSESELMDFLFLPGFSLRTDVTEISGRGVGLDIVQSRVRDMRGTVRASSRRGAGTVFTLDLPISLALVECLFVSIADEAYALPLARIQRICRVPVEDVESSGGLQFHRGPEGSIALIDAAAVLELGSTPPENGQYAVVVLSDGASAYGVVVDAFEGEGQITLQSLDPLLGKVRDIRALGVMPSGAPTLVLDVDDFLVSIQRFANRPTARSLEPGAGSGPSVRVKRVLVVDDSLTVRELERKTLSEHGYEVEVAVDGVDGWNALRGGSFDLVITDIDMPRMDGIQLIHSLRGDTRFKALPTIIVSYKDRPEDRKRGLEAGADYYLTKGSFQNEGLLNAVFDLIGGPV